MLATFAALDFAPLMPSLSRNAVLTPQDMYLLNNWARRRDVDHYPARVLFWMLELVGSGERINSTAGLEVGKPGLMCIHIVPSILRTSKTHVSDRKPWGPDWEKVSLLRYVSGKANLL